jgi:hypothetical protein
MREIIIIGGGASGLAAAIAAARSPENHITLLERQSRVGRKLLSTGNGRCNLTNLNDLRGHYHGEEPEFSSPALEKFGSRETLEFFEGLGLLTTVQPDGRVYPLSDHAGSVVDVLRFAAQQDNVDLLLGTEARYIEHSGGVFAVGTSAGELRGDRVIVACGGAAGSKLGGVMDGYTLLKSLGHKRTGLYPALTQVKTDATYPKALKGVKADAAVRVLAGRHVIAESAGEVLFTETGVSGPAIFDISRAVSTGGEGLALSLDLLREYTLPEVVQRLCAKCAALPAVPSAELFTGFVHNRLGRMLCKYAAVPQDGSLGDLAESVLSRAAECAKDFRLDVQGVAGFDSAQVTAGGIRTSDFDPNTMESRLVPRLYATGEVLDVDGDCGGFNLQWAWASGVLAGVSAGD